MAWNVIIHFLDGDRLEQNFNTEDEAEDFANGYRAEPECYKVEGIELRCDEDDDAGYYEEAEYDF